MTRRPATVATLVDRTSRYAWPIHLPRNHTENTNGLLRQYLPTGTDLSINTA